jgi:DEAD/DEAH box helicase domain-containing protein
MDLVMLDLPQTSFSTQALWFEFDSHQLTGLPSLDGGGASRGVNGATIASRDGGDGTNDATIPMEALLGSLHATEHAQIAVLPLIAMCDRWDIGGLSTNMHPQTGGPTIFIYDGHPGGIGITRLAYQRFEELCRDAHGLIAECPCKSGCPSCVQSPKCGNLNEPLSKAGARVLLEGMLGL